MARPYPFKGGNISDYETFIGQAGTYNTRYIPTGQTVPCIQPSGGFTSPSQLLDINMLSIASLALGVLNLGVGVYNAFQLQKTQKKLDQNHEQIRAYFGSIQNALNAHQRTLEVLVSSQYGLSQQMNILREEMRSDFQQIVREIQGVEARRRRKEFYANTYELMEVYKRFIDHLPDLSEADRLIDRAEKLEAWLLAELDQVSMGKPERLPLVVALFFSVRAKADAFEAKGGKYMASADKALNKLKKQIQREAYALCNGRSLYTLGVEIPEIVYQYALLQRSLAKGIELRLNPKAELAFLPEEVAWKDGLDDFRKIFEQKPESTVKDTVKINEKTVIHLKTLADCDWYIRFSGEDPSTFDVHSRQSIRLSDLFREIGHPNPTEGILYKSDLYALMLFSLPEACNKFASRIQEEFSWEEHPKISGSSFQ
ncbi:hypothetical protein [Leptolyngbya sp. FACHB-261]|uniref:hypothetical protein n=1 Tax=Leptolyngbya sp. FACHB-261 TaxID=2692806 RepID=UPI001688017E|nr:hypothetical protein [Leptolyngbya sp. FACHB-261]MBD2104831.1 hypothetical protein [Leptolyngbya sp. FACHB-261]